MRFVQKCSLQMWLPQMRQLDNNRVAMVDLLAVQFRLLCNYTKTKEVWRCECNL